MPPPDKNTSVFPHGHIDCSRWKHVRLGDLVDRKIISMGRGNVISKETIASSPGTYPVFSSSASGDGIIGYYSKFMFDDERLSWSIDGGGRFFGTTANCRKRRLIDLRFLRYEGLTAVA